MLLTQKLIHFPVVFFIKLNVNWTVDAYEIHVINYMNHVLDYLNF